MGNTLGVVDINSPLGTLLRIVAPGCAIILYLTPLSVMRDIFKYKSTRELTIAPYVSMFMLCSLWTCYALVAEEYTVLISAAPGTVLSILYYAIFRFYCLRPEEMPKYTASLFLYASILLLLFFLPALEKKRLEIFSVLAVLVRIIFLASPFMTVRKVVRNKSVESMPFGLSFANLINALSWLLFGWLVAVDSVIIISHSFAIVLSVLQLILQGLYGNCSFRTTQPDEASSTTTSVNQDATMDNDFEVNESGNNTIVLA